MVRQAKNHQNKSSIRFGSLLDSSNSLGVSKEKDRTEDLLRSHVFTLSGQVEELKNKTDLLLHKPRQKSPFQWNLVFMSVFMSFLIFTAGFLYLSQRQIDLNQDIMKNVDNQQSLFDKQFQQTTQDMKKDISSLEKKYLESKEFALDKIHQLERNLTWQSDRVTQINTQISQHRERLAELGEGYASTKLQLDGLRNSPLQKSKVNELMTKLSRWEQSQSAPTSFNQLKSVHSSQKNQSLKNEDFSTVHKNDIVNDRDKTYAKAYAKIAWKESKQGNIQKSISAYEKSLSYDPSLAISYYNLACIYATRNNKQKALDWLKKGLPYFSNSLLEAAKKDKDLEILQEDPYFQLLLSS